MKNVRLKEILLPTVVLTVICLVAAVALSVTNLVTQDKIAQNEKEKTDSAMMAVMPCDEFTSVGENGLYKALKDGNTVGYAIMQTQTGYGGDVSVMVGINPDGTVAAIEIVSCDDETPGLGQNIKTDDFKSGFSGISKKAVLSENVDAVTGATISSTAVTNAVNNALEIFKQEVTVK